LHAAADRGPQVLVLINANNVSALRAAGWYRIFIDTASGARDDRSELGNVLDRLSRADTLGVRKLDRLGHSLRHLIATVTEFRRRRPDEYTGEALPRVRCTPSDGLSAKHWPDAWPVRRSHSRQRHGEPATKPPPTIPDGVRWSGPRTRPAELIKSTVIRERNACVERMTYALGGPKFWPEWGGYPDAPYFP